MTSNRRTFLQQLGFAGAGLGLVSFVPGCQTAGPVAGRSGLPRSTPEAEGVSSKGVLAFLDAVARSLHEFQSFMLIRHGRVVAEGWWTPYGPEFVHTMYSMSKSFTSTAVGLAVGEGRLTVDDRVVSFFPDDLPAKVSDNLAALRVKDLLSMSVGHDKDPTFEVVKQDNWTKAFFAWPIPHAPGTKFVYNSAATYLCSAIVQKLTGQRIIDYMRPRLFEPLGVSGMTWETCPRGINTGGWGLSIQSEGLARFGQLYLQKGNWRGRQVLPTSWVNEATTFKIQQPLPAKPNRPNNQNDWLQGYCYQFWRSQHNAFRGDGAFGQFTIVLPDQDAVIAITGESKDMQGELDLVWEHLLPALKDKALPADAESQARLRQTLSSLALALPKGQATSPIAKQVSRRTFQLKPNKLGLQTASFDFQNGDCVVALREERSAHVIHSGLEKWQRGETALPGTPPRLISGGAPKSGTKSKLAAAGAWKDDHTFEMIWRYYETPHHDTVACRFDGDIVRISFTSSIVEMRPNTKDQRTVLEGETF